MMTAAPTPDAVRKAEAGCAGTSAGQTSHPGGKLVENTHDLSHMGAMNLI